MTMSGERLVPIESFELCRSCGSIIDHRSKDYRSESTLGALRELGLIVIDSFGKEVVVTRGSLCSECQAKNT